MAPRSTSLFVRPRNMNITNMLQSLSIAANLARRSDGKVKHFKAPRESFAQRMLNYAGITLDDTETARQLTSQPDYFIGLSKRAALSHPVLYYDLLIGERGASLADVASIVGLRLGDRSYDFTKAADEGDFAPRGKDNTMDCRIERRQTSARQRPSNKSIHLVNRSHRKLLDVMGEFGGFSGRLRAGNGI